MSSLPPWQSCDSCNVDEWAQDAQARLAELTAENAELRRLLEKVTHNRDHVGSCSIGRLMLEGQRCICGLDAARAFLRLPAAEEARDE